MYFQEWQPHHLICPISFSQLPRLQVTLPFPSKLPLHLCLSPSLLCLFPSYRGWAESPPCRLWLSQGHRWLWGTQKHLDQCCDMINLEVSLSSDGSPAEVTTVQRCMITAAIPPSCSVRKIDLMFLKTITDYPLKFQL